MANQHLQSLMQKEMTRKQFLGVVALGIGSIFGMEQILKLAFGKSLRTNKVISSPGVSGYGK